MLQSHNLWPDRFLSTKLDCEGERERETDRQFQKGSLPPLQHEASVIDKTIQTERRERWHKRLQAKVHAPTYCRTGSWKYSNVEVFQSQAQDGHDGIGFDLAPAKRFFKVHWYNRSSFFPVDWHSEHHKKIVLTAAERNRQRVPEDVFCTTKIEIRPGRAPFSCWSRRLTALAWPWCTRTRASSPRRHFVSPCACSDIPHLSTFTWNGPLCAVLG